MHITTIEDFLDYFERVRERTRRVAALAPPDRLEWRPREDRFSLGDLIRHIGATERWMWAENVCGRPSRYPGCGIELASGYDAVLAYLDAMHAEATTIFGSLTAEDLQRRVPTPGGVQLTAWKWLRAMVEHEIHHRGQIYERLADLGVAAPPLYGLTEPQVLANSEPRRH
ncbi:MAG: DinB family protein [Gemmatimonadota bacterium]